MRRRCRLGWPALCTLTLPWWRDNERKSMTADASAPVSSHDEWSPLREVVVGTPYHLDYHEDASFRLFFHQNLPRAGDGPGTRAAANRLFRNVRPGNQLKDECL